MRVRHLDKLLIVALASALAGCLFDSSDSSSSRKGSISIVGSGTVAVAQGSYTDLQVKLAQSQGVSGQLLSFSSSDKLVSEITPSKCALSSEPDSASTCTVRVHGHKVGTSSLQVASVGYDPQSATAVVSATPAADTLVVLNNTGANAGSYTAGTASVTYSATGPTPNQVTLTGKIAGLTGVDGTKTTAFVSFAMSDSKATSPVGLPNQCAVTTAVPSCSVTFTASDLASYTLTAKAGGSFLADLPFSQLPKPVTISVSPTATPGGGNGLIALGSNASNVVYQGFKAPLFVYWEGAATADKVALAAGSPQITYTGKNAVPVQFYSYNAGDNTTPVTGSSAPVNCSLNFTGKTSTSTMSCGYGLMVTPNAVVGDTVTITVPPITTAVGTYKIAPLTLTVAAAEAPARTVTFTNQSGKTLWVGITGGGGWSYVGPTATTIPPGTPAANIKPGAGSACGPSNPTAACPSGTTCTQGGAAPSSDISKSPFYCYYDQGQPGSGFKLAANGGSTTLSISASSMSPNGMIWSGNFFARGGCDSGACTLNCNASNDGGACSAATGVNPGVATLAELTFVKDTVGGPDYYDVSIINGANVAAEFGPDPGSFSPAPAAGNGYNCGIAGARTAGASSFGSSSVTNLPNASWSFAPTASNFPPGASLTGSPASYYRYVLPGANSAPSCTSTANCTSAVATDVCGYASGSVSGQSPNYRLVCGAPVSWMTADSIWGFNRTASNTAPFAFNVSDTNPTSLWTATGQKTATQVGDYQLCINNTYSSYQPQGGNPTILACGGAMWGNTQTTLPNGAPAGLPGLQVTHVASPANTASTNWLNYVLPTITWLKAACPTCYTWPFDDRSSTFTCNDSAGASPSVATAGVLNYNVKFYDLAFQ